MRLGVQEISFVVASAIIILVALGLSVWNYFGKRQQEILSGACKDILIKMEFLNVMVTDYLTFRGYPDKLDDVEFSKDLQKYKDIIDTRYAVTKMEIGKIKDDLLAKLGKTEFKKACAKEFQAEGSAISGVINRMFFEKNVKNLDTHSQALPSRADESMSETSDEAGQKASAARNVSRWSTRGGLERVLRRQGLATFLRNIFYVRVWIDICRLEIATTFFCRTLGKVRTLEDVAYGSEYFDLRQSYETVVKEIYHGNTTAKVGLSEVISILSLAAAIVTFTVSLISGLSGP